VYRYVEFDMLEQAWSDDSRTPTRVVTALAIHHLPARKRSLFGDPRRPEAEGLVINYDPIRALTTSSK
jgi:hypothetical protein